jgi:acyl-CoA dehydrogenase
MEMRELARAAGAATTPHIRPDGSHFNQRRAAVILIKSGLTPLGMLACNTQAPDEGNMYLIGHVGSPELQGTFPQAAGGGPRALGLLHDRTAELNGAGADPSMMLTTCRKDGNHWVVNGKKCFITGAEGAKVGIVMAKSEDPDSEGGACMFLVDLPDPPIQIAGRSRRDRQLDARQPRRDRHRQLAHVRPDQMLGDAGEGFKYRRSASSPARLSHCMRWLGGCMRAQEIATDYANRRIAFRQGTSIDHEGVGSMLAEDLIDIQAVRTGDRLVRAVCYAIPDRSGRQSKSYAE